jgi:hypothetical protein
LHIGKIYRFDYNNTPHISVKFYIEDKDKTGLDILLKSRKDKRILDVVLDIKGQMDSARTRYSEETTEVREKITERNRDILEKIGWFKADKYFNDKYTLLEEITTIIIEFDTGVDWERCKWLKNHLVPGYDTVDDDNIPLDEGYENFRAAHGTGGAEIMASLSSETAILPMRVFSYSNISRVDVELAMEMALQAMNYIEGESGTNYNIIANMSFSWVFNPKTKDEMQSYWRSDIAKNMLFDEFIEQASDEIIQAGYDPDKLTYQDVMGADRRKDWREASDDDIIHTAIKWMFNAIHRDGTLSGNLFPTDEGGIWSPLSQMKEEGWKIITSSGNDIYNFDVYPGKRKEAEAIEQVYFPNDTVNCPWSHDFTELAAPGIFEVYDPQDDAFYTKMGSSVSAFITSALYAKIWDLAPNLDYNELDRIIKGTAYNIVTGDGIERKMIHSYRAVRIGWVYANIKEYVQEFEDRIITYSRLESKVKNVLNDVEDERDFADIDTYKRIFAEGMKPLHTILDILIEDIKTLLPQKDYLGYKVDFLERMFAVQTHMAS